MKHYEFYAKHKINYRPAINPVFYKRNWWQIVLLTLAAVLIEPLIMYKYRRSVPFSLNYYLHVLGYCSLIAVPVISFLLWINWRESIKHSRGYVWVGKFEVIKKQSSFVFFYLLLAPGNGKLRVERRLFERTRVGNFIQIRRDALGNIEEIKKVNDLPGRLAKTGARTFLKNFSKNRVFMDLMHVYF